VDAEPTVLLASLAELEPMLLDGEYVVLGYPRGSAPPTPEALAAESFSVRIDDPLATTLILRRPIADELPPAGSRQDGLRVILLLGELPPDLTGFLSTVGGALAERGVPVIPIGAATRDHLLVPEDHWPEALAVLRGLRDAARGLLAGTAPETADD
jgi:hypothetical protein